jgi:hypothetical protein
MGAAAGVRADQDPSALVPGQLRRGQPGGLDVVGGGVRPGVPGPQHDREGLPVPAGPVLGPAVIGWKPKGFFQMAEACSLSVSRRLGKLGDPGLPACRWRDARGSEPPGEVGAVSGSIGLSAGNGSGGSGSSDRGSSTDSGDGNGNSACGYTEMCNSPTWRLPPPTEQQVVMLSTRNPRAGSRGSRNSAGR